MTAPTSERRAGNRVAVDLDVRLARGSGAPVAGRTIDLGAGGMRISAARPLRVDEVLDFDLALDTDHPVTGKVRVMRLHPRNQYGLRFEGLAPTQSETIVGFIGAR